jgi:hypothetical protein
VFSSWAEGAGVHVSSVGTSGTTTTNNRNVCLLEEKKRVESRARQEIHSVFIACNHGV